MAPGTPSPTPKNLGAPAKDEGGEGAPTGTGTDSDSGAGAGPGANTDLKPREPTEPDDPPDSQTDAETPIERLLRVNNLVRPSLAADWRAAYPDCAKLAREGSVAAFAARTCLKTDMQTFNTAHLVPYQTAYEVYVPKTQDLSFRLDAGAELDFVTEEARGFTRKTLPVIQSYSEARDLRDEDMAKLRRQAY
ncbi:MAG: hypothetical protein AAF291_05740 [Pseudomonadota bacterium]